MNVKTDRVDRIIQTLEGRYVYVKHTLSWWYWILCWCFRLEMGRVFIREYFVPDNGNERAYDNDFIILSNRESKKLRQLLETYDAEQRKSQTGSGTIDETVPRTQGMGTGSQDGNTGTGS